jgi:branched-chain amino acid transport system permease protein
MNKKKTSTAWINIRRDLWIGAIFLLVAILLPIFGVSNYALTQVTLFFIWAAVVTQWNLVFGVAGVFSLGHMAVFAAGGYVTAMTGLYLPLVSIANWRTGSGHL